MWTEPTMPFGQSVIVSLLGLSVVFLALICLEAPAQTPSA